MDTDGKYAAAGGAEPVTVHRVRFGDARTAVLLDGLAAEYAERYGPEDSRIEMEAHPHTDFAPPHGGVVLLEARGRTVAGGAFRRWEAGTAEFKRVWTSPGHRRRGLARRTVAALEEAARDQGYRRVFLFTGPEQPEAVALYTRLGYTRLRAQDVPELPYPRCIPFERDLDLESGARGVRRVRRPGPYDGGRPPQAARTHHALDEESTT